MRCFTSYLITLSGGGRKSWGLLASVLIWRVQIEISSLKVKQERNMGVCFSRGLNTVVPGDNFCRQWDPRALEARFCPVCASVSERLPRLQQKRWSVGRQTRDRSPGQKQLSWSKAWMKLGPNISDTPGTPRPQSILPLFLQKCDQARMHWCLVLLMSILGALRGLTHIHLPSSHFYFHQPQRMGVGQQKIIQPLEFSKLAKSRFCKFNDSPIGNAMVHLIL